MHCIEIKLLLKMVKKPCAFKNLEENLKKPGRNSKILEEIQKTWRKFPKIFWPPPCIIKFGIYKLFPSYIVFFLNVI